MAKRKEQFLGLTPVQQPILPLCCLFSSWLLHLWILTVVWRDVCRLPEQNQKDDNILKKERNVLQVRLNKDDQLMCGKGYIDIKQLREKAKEFIANPYDDENLPENIRRIFPLLGDCMVTEQHVISVQNDVGTSYQAYINVQNELVAAYNELRDELGKS